MNIEDYGISVSFDEDFNRGEKKSTADIDSKQIGKFVLTLKDVEDGCGGIFVFCGLHIITWYVDQNKKNIVINSNVTLGLKTYGIEIARIKKVKKDQNLIDLIVAVIVDKENFNGPHDSISNRFILHAKKHLKSKGLYENT